MTPSYQQGIEAEHEAMTDERPKGKVNKRKRKRTATALRKCQDTLEQGARARTATPCQSKASLHAEIATRKWAEEALRESEQRFKDIAEIASDWFWEMDENFRFTYFSEPVTEIAGAPPEFHYGKTRWELAAADEDSEKWEEHRKLLEAHEPFRDFKYDRVGPDGQVRYLTASGVPVFDANGDFKGYRGTGSDITERKQAEDARRESEEKFKDFAEMAADWFWETGPDLRFTYFTARAEEVTGVPIAASIGQTREEAAGVAINTEKWRRHLRDLKARRPFHNFEYERRGSDGCVRHITTSGRPVFDRDGAFLGYRGCASDITARKQAEQALTESEQRYRELVDLSPDGIFVNVGNKLRFVNGAAVTLFGADGPDDLIGRSVFDFIAPEFHDRVKDRIRVATERRRKLSLKEINYRRLDGTEFCAEVTSRSFRFRGEAAILVCFRDITVRKRAEDALRESEERFKDFAELASDWFWEMDENLRFSYFSESFTLEGRINLNALLGKTRKEPVAPHEDSESWRSHLDTLAARKPFRGFIYSRLDDHGTEMHIRLSGSPVFDADGTFLGYRGTGSDITAEVEALQALRAARDEAQLANAAKSEFLANMSHELRTPLNAVVGFSELMKQETLGPIGNPKYLDYAKDIHDSGNQLLDRINDILDLSKVESGKEELQEEVLDIDELLESVRMLVSGRADRGGVRLAFDVAEGLPALYADQRKLKQIFVNLMSNAIKFTDAGGRVTFRVWNGDDGMVFQVVDTGIGIAADDIPIALAPFRQIEHGLARKYQGSGLGLPLAKSLVEMHGGSLDLQSQPDAGTTVTVRLPASRVMVAAAAQRKRAS